MFLGIIAISVVWQIAESQVLPHCAEIGAHVRIDQDNSLIGPAKAMARLVLMVVCPGGIELVTAKCDERYAPVKRGSTEASKCSASNEVVFRHTPWVGFS
jgi:hypothetical protein